MSDKEIIVRCITINRPGHKEDGSWLNFADLRAYFAILRDSFPDDRRTLEKLDEVMVAAMIFRDEDDDA